MVEYYFRRDGKKYNAESYMAGHFPDKRELIRIVRRYIRKNLEKDRRPTDVNFVEYPHLGDELYLDERIDIETAPMSVEYYNRIAGACIYLHGDDDENCILVDEYRDRRIVYIVVGKRKLIEEAMNAIHEINHLNDPYNGAMRQRDNITQIKRFKSKLLLNEYYAEYRAHRDFERYVPYIDSEIEEVFDDFCALSQFNLDEMSELLDQYIRFGIPQMNADDQNGDLVIVNILFSFFSALLMAWGRRDGMNESYPECAEMMREQVWKPFMQRTRRRFPDFIGDAIGRLRDLVDPQFTESGNVGDIYSWFDGVMSRFKDGCLPK